MQKSDISPDVKRAWVLVQVDKEDLGTVASDILKLNEGWRDAYNGVVGADVVEGDFNILVYLYTKDNAQMTRIGERIKGVEGVAAATFLPVQGHFPPAADDTGSYISDYGGDLIDPEAGPQGVNPWG